MNEIYQPLKHFFFTIGQYVATYCDNWNTNESIKQQPTKTRLESFKKILTVCHG